MLYYKNKNIVWNIIQKFSNLNASIIILLLIAATSILGTVIEQDQSLDYYKLHYSINNNSTILNWKIIIFLGLNNIYFSWWFICLITLFFCTLIACTFSRQLPGLKNARSWKFTPYTQIDKYQKILPFNNIKTLSNIIYELNRKRYYIFHKADKIYGYKGIIGRIAPIFVHISIIITLTGSILGLLYGFTAQQIIPNSEIFHVQNIIKSGYISKLPNNLVGKIDNFIIQYNTDKSIQQFYSYISLFNNQGKCLKKQKIAVNSPLKFRGITFYQTDWKINNIRIKINNKYHLQEHLEKVKLVNNDLWIYKLPLNTNQYISLILINLENEILIYNKQGEFLYTVGINENFQVNGISIKIEEIMTQTGIQIKTDPGIPYVYIGFLVLMTSIIMSYISYSQIWVSNKTKTIKIKGITNRNKLIFEEELTTIQKNILKY